jgi:hypothetical protein
MVPAGHIALGVPSKHRAAPDLHLWVDDAVRRYRAMAKRYRTELHRIA